MNIEGSISFLDLLSFCFGCTAGHADYILKLEENCTSLRTAMEELKELRNDLRMSVINLERPRIKRLDQVQGWLLRVEAVEAQVDELIRDCSREVENKCLGGCCPKNCKSSYKLGRKAAKKLEQVNALKAKGVFQKLVEELPPFALVDQRPSEPTIGLDATLDEIWGYICDEDLGVIGLYGMGGVGKTTLLTKVNNKLGNSAHSFDVVIWVVVSQNADITKIQNAIGNKVGLPDDGNRSREEKAIDVFRVLSTKRFVLFLDDLWERLDLSRMGIPHPDNQNKSKVVFTTRSKDLCGRMEAHRKIEVKCLAWDNAWDLFQKKVGDDALDAHLEIPQLAKTMAKECGGLPLALVTIGRAMASKTTLQEWCHAIAVLKKSAAEFSGMGDEVFPLLKFSYDSLPSNTVRSCFLYCCLFPEDYFIPKEQLIEYWFGEGFLDRSEELNGVQNHGHDIIGTLIRACLLEEEDGGNKMKMHDVIRDMGMWISCECGKANDKLLVQAGAGLKKAPQFEKWERVEKMSLMRNGIEELTETPSCLNLSTLLLSFNNLKVISHGFFQTMPKLRVLDLSLNWNLKELPAEISELTTLQYLNLSHTSIREFPVELKNLVGLKFLSLEDTNKLSRISLGILSSFKKLRVLKMLGCGSSYVTEEGVLEEVKGLKELNRLGISIRSVSALSHFLNSPNLLRYTRELGMENIQGLLDMYSIIVHASCVERLRIKRCEDLIFELPGKGVEDSNTLSPQPCFHHLCDIRISKCRMLKDLTWLVYAPNLKYLKVEYCERMEEIVSGGEMARDEEYLINQVFPQLQALYLRKLPHLKSIYPNALPCSCLNLIQVFGCRELKKLPLNSNSAKGCQIQIRGDGEWWDGLEWEDEATRDAFLPSHTPYETSAM